jgi:HAD superfamily hydrolase (TIGR01509 family)
VLGRSLPDKCALLAEVLGEQGNEAAISTELLALALDAISAGATARPGARDLLALVASAVPVAVVSNSPRALLRASLSRAGLADLLPITVAADTVTRAKPASDPYLAACSLLGVPPADTLAVEDSPIGLDSARTAGLVTLAVPSNPGLTLRASARGGTNPRRNHRARRTPGLARLPRRRTLARRRDRRVRSRS